MNCSIRIGGALVCILVGLGGCALLGLQGPTAEAAVLLPGTDLDYADPASWDISGVPGDTSYGTHPAIIASSGHGTRSAIYSSSSNFTTTNRLLLGHTATGNGTLTMSGGAGTLTFGGDSVSSANYVGVDGGTGVLNVGAGTLAVTGGAWLRIGANAAGSTGTVNLSGSGAITVASHVLVGANQPSNVGVVNISGNGHLTAQMVGVGSNRWTPGTWGVGGQGTLNISGNGQLTTTGAGPRVFIGDGASGAPTATFTLADNGQVHSAHDFIVGFTSPGTGAQAGGTIHVAPAGSFFVGAFATGAHTQTGGSVIIAPGSPNGLRLGHGGGGNGTYNLNGGVLELSTLSIGSGGGVFNMGGGTLRAGGALNTAVPIQLTGGISTIDTNSQNVTLSGVLSGGGAMTKTGAGTLTLSAPNTYTGSTVVQAGTLHVAAGGALVGTNLINPVSGSTLTISGNVTVADNGAFAVGNGATGLGTVNIEAGAVVNIGNGAGGYAGRTYIGGRLDGAGSLGTGTLNLNGGVLNVAAGGAGITGDASNFWMNAWGNGGTSTLNLNGGTLSTARSILDGGGGGSVVNFNGGTLQAAAGIDLVINSNLTANIHAGGLMVDSQNFNATISKALSHGTGSPDGGLTKIGAGTLTLTGANSYTGTTTVSAGVLQFAGAGSAYSGGTFAGNIVVEQNGTLRFARHDTFGNAPSNPAVTITVNGGTVTNSPGWFTPLGAVVLNQGTVAAGQGHSTWDAFLLKGTVTTVAAADSSYLTSTGANSAFHLNSTGTTFDVADGAAQQDLVVSSVLANYYPGTAGSLIKTGAGIMAVSGANTYTGGTTVNDGTLFMRYDLGSGVGSGTVTVDGTGSGNRSNFLIWAPGAVTINNDFVLNSMGPAANRGAINHDGGAGLVTLNGQITLAGDSRIGVGGSSWNDMVINGKITGPGKLYVAETTGRSTILTSGANDYSGGTEVEAGALRIGHAGALGSGDVSIADGANLLLWWNAGSNTVANNFTLNGLGSFNGKDAIYADGGGGGHGEYVLSGQITLNADSNIGGHTINHLRITGKVTGPGGLTKGGNRGDENNTLFLANTGNDYAGVTTFFKGTVNVASLADNGTAGSLGVGTGDTVANRIGLLFRGGTLQYTGSTPQSTDRQVRLSTTGGGGTIDASGTNPSATLSFTGTSSLNFWENAGTRTLTLTGSNTGDNTFALPIPDIAGTTTTNLTKSGAGTWVLGGNNSYAGQTEVNAGVLRMTGAGSLGAGGFATAPRTRVNPGATLEMTGTWSTNEHLHLIGSGAGGAGAIHSLSGTQTITTQAALNGPTTINVDAGAVLRMNHTFYGAAGSLTKIGPGILELNRSNTYAGGPTTIDAGTLMVNGSLGNTAVAVNNGGTLAGTGTISGTVTVHAGGTHAPGASVGSQTAGGAAWMPGGTFEFEINDALGMPGGPDGWDELLVNGTVDLTNLTDQDQFLIDIVSLDGTAPGSIANFVATQPYEWPFLRYEQLEDDYFSPDLFELRHDGLFQNEIGRGHFTVLQMDIGGANWLAVGYVPEPGTWLLLISALGCGLLMRRRRAV